MIKISINVTRIPREKIVVGKNGKYADFVLFDKPDSYGNSGFVAMDVTKEEREAGTRGPIVGNWKEFGAKKPVQQQSAPKPPADPDLDVSDDDIPF